MPSRDADVTTYGALQYYQMHYVVDCKMVLESATFLAKCSPITKGHFKNKRVVDVKWNGGRIAEVLDSDKELNEQLKLILLEEGEIRLDPLDDVVRIYGKWKHEDDLIFDRKVLEVIDRIAYHIKELNRLTV
ncbi:MAG TPA: hypothetical protein VE089_10000 [Nitrososphaeraceae archaeon]|nr:hypothetical protein [Nitrososphaeraceae archaeon]